MEALIAIGALIIIVIFLLLFIYLQNKQFSEKESKLLDREKNHACYEGM